MQLADSFRKRRIYHQMELTRRIKDLLQGKRHLPTYKPIHLSAPARLLEVNSAWKGLELIVEDILNRFHIERNNCIEFGVEFGYSTVVFSNYFEHVVGIDTFEGDIHTSHKGDHFQQTKERLSAYGNIELIKSDFKEWIQKDKRQYNFSHVDIVHTYEDTYACGLWAAEHSDCTILHDTESFPTVRNAVADIARASRKKVYNYPHCFGLGIIV